MQTRVLDTSVGQVEVVLTPGVGDVVLCFPGGHATAATPLCADLYAELGYRPLTFSRPGYGLTDVGDLTAAEFVPAVAEVCKQLAFVGAAATVGVSFGGLQAIHVAAALPHLAPRLILHSCAPSTRPYPDLRAAGRDELPLEPDDLRDLLDAVSESAVAPPAPSPDSSAPR
jgi:pimeloyl-ACP methyl ester carboxylesterase